MLSDQRVLQNLLKAAVPQDVRKAAESTQFDASLAVRGLNQLLGLSIRVWDGTGSFPSHWEDALFIVYDSHGALVTPTASASGEKRHRAMVGEGFECVLPASIDIKAKAYPVGPWDLCPKYLRMHLKCTTQRNVERLRREQMRELNVSLMALGTYQLHASVARKLQTVVVRARPLLLLTGLAVVVVLRVCVLPAERVHHRRRQPSPVLP